MGIDSHMQLLTRRRALASIESQLGACEHTRYHKKNGERMSPGLQGICRAVVRPPVYLFGGCRYLENWPSFIAARVKLALGIKPKLNQFRFRNGLIVNIPPSRNVSAIYEFYELIIRREYTRESGYSIGPSDTVIDIGASFGLFTTHAARLASNGRVCALEPCPADIKPLRQTLKDSGLSNVLVREMALGPITGRTTLSWPQLDGAQKEVPMICLADLFAEESIQGCDFLKMDIEGAEYEVFEHIPSPTLAKIKRISMEWHNKAAAHDPAGLASFLRNAGYTVIVRGDYRRPCGYMYAQRNR